MKLNDSVMVMDWLKDRREFLEIEGSSYSQLSIEATEKFEFTVTTGSIKTMIEALDIQLKKVRVSRSSSAAAAAAESASQIEYLIQIIVNLIQSRDNMGDGIRALHADEDIPADVLKAVQAAIIEEDEYDEDEDEYEYDEDEDEDQNE